MVGPSDTACKYGQRPDMILHVVHARPVACARLCGLCWACCRRWFVLRMAVAHLRCRHAGLRSFFVSVALFT